MVWGVGKYVFFVRKGPGEFFFLGGGEVFKNCFIVEVVVYRYFLVDVEMLYGIQLNAFFLGL